MGSLFAEYLALLKKAWKWFFRPLPVAVTVAAWVSGIVLFLLVSLHLTSKANFCSSCHVMEPYYDSWKTSTHSFVECVDCHIPPGIEATIDKKVEALNMVVSYFTGSYGSNPWAEIDDAACLRCHEKGPLAGPVDFNGVLFDHAPHLEEMRRGKQLRCTSCHSQIVQGSHMTVTPSTCALCHFREDDPGHTDTQGKDLSDCQLCHETPNRVIEKGTLSFNHGDVERFDMECAWCHAHVVKGDGSATKSRCYVCHNDPGRLATFDDHEHMHQIHVTDHKVECLHCHTEIQHGTFDSRSQIANMPCGTCHEGGHSPQRDLWVGIGGKGTEPRPNNMHLAGIQCEGCHFLSKEKGKGAGTVHTAGGVSCVSCHGDGYDNMLDRWNEVSATRVRQAQAQLSQARRRLPKAHQALADAQANIDLVAIGRGAHNIDYAVDVLQSNEGLLNTALQAAGKKPVAPAWQPVPFTSDCLRCHQGIELQAGLWQGKDFDHGPHVIDHALDCQQCHRAHEDRDADEIVSLSQTDGCVSCHHSDEHDFSERCATCHAGVMDQIQTMVFDWGEDFDHEYHVAEEELECLDCHADDASVAVDTEMCLDCHE